MSYMGFDKNGDATPLRFNSKLNRPPNPHIRCAMRRMAGATKNENDRQNQQNGWAMREKLQAKLKAKQQN